MPQSPIPSTLIVTKINVPLGFTVSPSGGSGIVTINAAAPVTFTANGVTPVTVVFARVTANSSIVFTLKTVGGTVGAYPAVHTITPGTGFTVVCTAADTSVYNVIVIG